MERKKISYIPLSIAVILLIPQFFLNAENLDLHIALSFLIITSCLVSIFLWHKVDLPIPSGDSNNEPRFFVYVSSTLYAVIAGFAITTAITFAFFKFGEDIEIFPLFITFELVNLLIVETMNLSDQFLMMIIFLATAIPFYHGAMRFLTRRSNIISQENLYGQIIHFVGLFSQAIIFLGISLVLTSLPAVITLIILLLIVDSAWILLGQKTNHRPPIGWLSLNIAFFASINLISYPMWSDYALPILAGFAIIRSFFDYIIFHEIFFDKPLKQ